MATMLPVVRTRFFDDTGQPLAGGLVYSYEAGTTTLKATYSDSLATVANTNPVVLDDAGSADIYLSGRYSIAVHDADNVLVESIDFATDAADTIALSDAITALNTDLTTRFQAADSLLTTSLNNEQSARAAQDTVLLNLINALANGATKAYLTYAALDAAKATLPTNSFARVTNDPDPDKNWLYQWNGTVLTKSDRDDLAVALAAVADEVADRTALIDSQASNFNFVSEDCFLQARVANGLLFILNLLFARNDGSHNLKWIGDDHFMSADIGTDNARFFGRISAKDLYLSGDGSGIDFVGSDDFLFARMRPTMANFSGISFEDDGFGGLRVVGADHFVITELDAKPEPIEVVDVSAPLFCSPLVTFSGQPVFIDVASLVAQRGLVNRTRNLLATISDQSGKGFEQSRETLRFLSSEYTTGAFLTLCDTANNTNTICRVPLTLRTAPVGLTGQANKNVLMIGDSITNRGIASLTKSYLSGYGYNTTFVGTLKTALDSQTSTQTGGEYAEAREGHETGDYTYRYTDRVQIVPVGGEETYLDLGLSNKGAAREFNPFLRAASGGDDPATVRNGYVFDCAFYQSRFAATSQPVPTPDVVMILLGTNNSRDRDGATLATEYAEDMAQMVNSAKAAWPSAKIIVGMHNTSSTVDRETVWEAEYAPMLRALINLRNSISGLIVAPIHALAPSEIGYSITTGSATTDSVTGALIGSLADDIHPQYSGRYQLAHVLASYAAAAIQNLI